MTFAFAQFVLFRSFLDLLSLFSTVFDDEEQTGNGDRMDDEEQIGTISANICLPKMLWTISFLVCRISVTTTDDRTTNRKNPGVPTQGLLNIS
jgi:hypothetical protein